MFSKKDFEILWFLYKTEGEGYIQGGKDSEVRNGYGALQKGGIRGIPPYLSEITGVGEFRCL